MTCDTTPEKIRNQRFHHEKVFNIFPLCQAQQRNLKTKQLYLLLKKTRSVKSHDFRDAIVFQNLLFPNCFRPYKNGKQPKQPNEGFVDSCLCTTLQSNLALAKKIKGSMDEQRNPKFTFASVAKRVFVENVWYESICHLYVHIIRMKIKSFSCETFCTSTRSEKEANGNSEVEVKSAYVPSGPSGQHSFQFLWHEGTRSITTTPWVGCQSIAGLPPNIRIASTYLYT